MPEFLVDQKYLHKQQYRQHNLDASIQLHNRLSTISSLFEGLA